MSSLLTLLARLQPNRPVHQVYGHVVAAAPGMTLIVPIENLACPAFEIPAGSPVPVFEVEAMLRPRYETSTPLQLTELMLAEYWRRQRGEHDAGNQLAAITDAFTRRDGIHTLDTDWRHTQIQISNGGQPCRIFIGAAGVRFAFVPDLLKEFQS